MAAFQDTREQTEKKVLVHLLSEVERDSSFTQRGLAAKLGIALGLMNHYLKSCVSKGWLRGSQISPHRIRYFLTPEGIKEKSHMVTDYLARSLTFFRDARAQCEETYLYCTQKGLTKIGLVGEGDLADIAKLVAHGTGIQTELVRNVSQLKSYDAILITDVETPQRTYDDLKGKVDDACLLTLKLLHISRSEP